MNFPLHPANAPLPRLQLFPVGSFALAPDGEDGELVKITGVYDASGRWTENAGGDVGCARIWDLTTTDEEF